MQARLVACTKKTRLKRLEKKIKENRKIYIIPNGLVHGFSKKKLKSRSCSISSKKDREKVFDDVLDRKQD